MLANQHIKQLEHREAQKKYRCEWYPDEEAFQVGDGFGRDSWKNGLKSLGHEQYAKCLATCRAKAVGNRCSGCHGYLKYENRAPVKFKVAARSVDSDRLNLHFALYRRLVEGSPAHYPFKVAQLRSAASIEVCKRR